MIRLVPLATASLFLASWACSHDNPLYCNNSDRLCTDPAAMFCDVAGTYPDSDGIGNTCIPYPWDAAPEVPDAAPPITCDGPGDTLRCEAGQLVTCSAEGLEVRDLCALGCHDAESRCNDVAPSNNLAEYLDAAPGGPDVELLDGATIDTSNGEIRDQAGVLVAVPSFLVPAPADGVPIRVFAVNSWRSGELNVKSSVAPQPALAIVSAGNVTLTGFMDLTIPFARVAGAFTASASCSGSAGVSMTIGGRRQSGGGGGGGHNGAGARGGLVENAVGGGDGGLGSNNPDLVPLRGGCSGSGASGGGAVQIVSRTFIEIDGENRPSGIDAGGKGGPESAQSDPANGGGAGGGILLEAPSVEIRGEGGLFANGGGGGCDGVAGMGSEGTRSRSRASGGSCAGPQYADGGAGGTDSAPGEGGTTPYNSGQSRVGGGGGGAPGYVRINTADGNLGSIEMTATSPTASAGVLNVR